MLIKSRVTSSVNRLLSMGKKSTMCDTPLVILQITFPNLNETWQGIKANDNQLLYASYKSFQATLCVFRHSRMCWRVWCASWASAEAGKPGREAGNIFLAISEFHKCITGGLHLAASERKTDVSCTPLSTLTQVQGSEAIMSDFILSSGSIL